MAHRSHRSAHLSREPVVLLLDEAPAENHRQPLEASAVTIAIVRDPARLLYERSVGLHSDVLDALVDLVVELVDEDEVDGPGASSR
jgi:hypothetical protein